LGGHLAGVVRVGEEEAAGCGGELGEEGVGIGEGGLLGGLEGHGFFAGDGAVARVIDV